MAYSAGTAFLQIIPSFKGVERALRSQAAELGASYDKAISKALPDGMAEGGRKARDHGEKAGDDYSGAFATQLRERLKKAFKQLPALELKGDSTDAEKSIARIKKTLQEVRDQHIDLEIDDKTALAAIRKLRAELKALNGSATDVTIRTNTAAALKEVDAIAGLYNKHLGERLAKSGSLSGDRFAEEFKKQVQAAAKNLPELPIRATTREADEAIDEIRRELRALGDADIGIDVSDAEAVARLAALRAQLAKIRDESQDIRLQVNTDAALKDLDKLDTVINARQREAQAAAQSRADRDVGEFARRVKTQLDGALKSVRGIDINDTDAKAKIDRIRQSLQSLQGANIGVDIDAAATLAEIQRIRKALFDLARSTPDIQVRADVAAAYGQLTAVSQLAKKLDGKKINLNVDLDKVSSGLTDMAAKVDAPLSRFGALISLGATIGPAIVPSAAAAAAAIGFIGTAAGSALAGVGVAVLALTGIGDAVKALNDYQNDAAKSAKSLGSSENQVANAVDGVSAAQRSLSKARTDAAFEAKRSAQQVEAARRSETRAEQDAVDAQKDLADAIKEVRQEEEDRTLQLRDNALAQRQATLDVADAKKQLDILIANPRATQAEIEQARITFDERQLQYEKLSVSQKRLQDEQDQFNKTGVDGTDKVVAAQKRVADSQQAVADSQQSLANALEDQKRSQRQSADAILSATENLAQAQRTLAQAYVSTGAAGGESLANLNQAMAKLTPTGQKFAKFIFGLKDELLSLKAPAEEGFLPGLQQSIELLLPFLPKVRGFIGDVAHELGDVAVQFARSFADDGWQRFFRFIGDETVPTLQILTTSTLNVAAGVRDLFLALTAFNQPIGKGLVDMTQSFATWAAQLESSSGYRKFLAYVHDVGPDVLDFFLELGKAIVHIVVAAAPVGAVVLHILDGILQFINSIPTGLLTVILGLLTSFAAVALLVSGSLKTVKFAVDTVKGAMLIWSKTIGALITKIREWRGATDDLGGSVTKSKDNLKATSDAVTGLGDATERTDRKTQAYRRTLDDTLGDLDNFGNGGDSVAGRQKAFTGELGNTAGALEQVAGSAGAAAGKAEELGASLENTGKKTSGIRGALGDLLGAIDPVGLAIAGFGALIAFQAVKESELQAKSEELSKAIINLGTAYQETHSIASTQVQDSIKQNKQLTDLIISTGRYGVATDKLARAAAGERDAQQQVLDTLKAKREELQRQIDANPAPLSNPLNKNDPAVKQQEETVKQIQLLQAQEAELRKTFGEINSAADAQKALADATSTSNIHFANAPKRIKDYVDQLDTLLDPLTAAADKTDILRQMDDSLYGAQRNLQEALEAQAQAHRDLNDVLSDKNLLDQKGARALDINTEAGQRLTDALEAELNATRDTYLANIANGDSIAEATKKHDEEITKIRESAKSKGLDQAATEKLIEIYGQVPSNRVTTFGTLNFDATKDQLAELMAYQLALREGISLGEARDKISPQVKLGPGRGNSGNAQLAAGGPVRGPGTKTSDSVPAYVPGSPRAFRLSDGEFVQQAAAVDYYGAGFMHALNQRKVPKKLLSYFGFYAGGGEIGYAPPQSYPMTVHTDKTRIPSKDEVGRIVKQNMGPTGAGPGFLPWPSSPAAQRGDTGVWRSVVNLVRSSGIPYNFGNAYRAGDPLWHGSGRAVDFMGYNQDTLAQFFLDRLPHVLELIHLTPKSGYFVTRGKRKANFAVQGPLHRNHLHIAMAQGGSVSAALRASYGGRGDTPPGWSPAYGSTGNTRMLSQRDLAAMQGLAVQPAAPAGGTYNIQFANTTLDASRFRAMQDREAAVARTGRPR